MPPKRTTLPLDAPSSHAPASSSSPAIAWQPVVSASGLSAQTAIDLLDSVLEAEIADVQGETAARLAAVMDHYAASESLDACTRSASRTVKRMAAADVQAVTLTEGPEAGSLRLSDWGVALPAEARGTMDEEGEDGSVGASSWSTYQERNYTGRPLLGYTSGALYLHGEWEGGFPPVHRTRWRNLVGEDADGLPERQRQAGSKASSTVNPTMVAQARETLRRPAFPDRGYPLPVGAGTTINRSAAIAADHDDAWRREEAEAASRLRALQTARSALAGVG